MNEHDDFLLAKEVAGGSHAAFGLLVNKYAGYLYAIAYRYVGRREEAQDIVQTCMLKFWERPARFDPARGVEFKTWIARVVVNQSIDFARKNKRKIFEISEFEIESGDESAPQAIERIQRERTVENAMKKLPISQQTALNLGFYQDLKYSEVAAIMKTTEAGVKNLVMRGKENLRKYIKEAGYV